MTSPSLPPGVTPEMMAALAAFFASQPQVTSRPRGILSGTQIRGVSPGYRYKFREYPKALNPPDVRIDSAEHERRFRITFKDPLPWDPAQPDHKQYIEDYYATQEYPKTMTPPQIIVNSQDEADAVSASWRAQDGEAEQSVVYPRWMFHADKEPRLVNNLAQESQLGEGWYPSPKALREATSGEKRPVQTMDEAVSHDELLDKALELGIAGVDKRWSVDRLKNAIAKVEARKGKAA